MSQFLTQAQSFKDDAERLRQAPVADERRRDEAYTRASELDRQALVEEVLYELARQPAIDPTPALDRRAERLQASQRGLVQTQALLTDAQDTVNDLRRELNNLNQNFLDLSSREQDLVNRLPILQDKVQRLEGEEASFYLGRIFNSPRYQTVKAERDAALVALENFLELIVTVQDDLLLDEANQDTLLDRITAAQIEVRHAQEAVTLAQERVDTSQGLFDETQRDEMTRRWEALEPSEQVRRIDERRTHQRMVQDRQVAWTAA